MSCGNVECVCPRLSGVASASPRANRPKPTAVSFPSGTHLGRLGGRIASHGPMVRHRRRSVDSTPKINKQNKSDVTWRWEKSEWENYVPIKKPPVYIGKGETRWMLLGVGSHVSVRAPEASQGLVEPVTPVGGVEGRGLGGGVEIGQTSARPGWVRTLLEHRRATNDVDNDRDRQYAFHERYPRAVGVTFYLTLSLSLSGAILQILRTLLSSETSIHSAISTLAWNMDNVTIDLMKGRNTPWRHSGSAFHSRCQFRNKYPLDFIASLSTYLGRYFLNVQGGIGGNGL
ncbi:hypothetical protein B0T18DRAFT_176753 [Schizothecium vesticola]|uniref:Uncharacterized protein n=1 Tax=Schizothecium vesticola TaxID=314040 RepID=A0AA40K2E8_9PEZI|nr:hypothetical protein B0T18DRAFT_176753 [Schizothecium vesticola]